METGSAVFLSGGGAMGSRMRARDWGATPLGPAGAWPQSLKTLVGVMLAAKQPMFLCWGPERLLLFNDAYTSILGGKDVDDALGRPFLDVWPDLREALQPLVDQVYGGEPVHMDDIALTLDRGDGPEDTHFAFSYTPVRAEDGSVDGLFCPCTETTGQVLADRRQRFRLDLDARLREVSDAAGIVRESVSALGRHLGAHRVGYGHVLADDQSIVLETSYADGLPPVTGLFRLDDFGPSIVAPQRRGETVVRADVLADTSDDPRAWLAVQARALISVPLIRDGRMAAGLFVNGREPRRWTPDEVALVEEVAARVWQAVDRARAEAALRDSEAHLAGIFRQTGAGFAETDVDGRFLSVNDHFCELVGRGRAELLALRMADITHPDDGIALPVERMAETGEAVAVEKRYVRPDGAEVWVADTVSLIASGAPSGGASAPTLLAVAIDIGERKRAERELAAARDAAEEANLAKSTFIANMSHELRTPLSAIIGYAEMLQEEFADAGGGDAPAEDVRKIETNARHLLGLINDVLDLSKIESGRMELYAETFDVAEMVGDLGSTVQALVDRKDNRLDLHLEPGLGTMHTDVTKLRQVLLNLLSNAAKFTEGGTVTLSVSRITGAHGDADWLVFRVADTGIGMTEEQLGRLFQRFTQADASTTRRFGGTGLGLSISKAFGTMLGGDLSVDSAPGEGSTFTIFLPATLPEAPAAAGEGGDHGAAPAPHRAPDVHRDVVLVIDDDPAQRDLMTRFLGREGFGALTAPDGYTGLQLARSLRPRAILLDVTMPGLDGWSVLSALKADPVLAAIPVVMVTFQEERGLATSLGAADYVMKPVKWERFRQVMDRFRDAEGDVLVVDDDPDTRHHLRTVLERDDWSVVEAGDGQAALASVAAALPRVVLLDLEMPVMDGFGFLESFRAVPGCADIPVVVLTARDLTREDRRRLQGASQILNKGETSLRALASRLRAIAEAAPASP
ncbi:response regulator [Lichenibacterium dinghuense]|uniref:response regulator n=1 Tax=Lichenibacterium dinghuense TaxID=2895977 RepID=UPI00272E80DC|nr:response regulator [Lichenibacterium sp. 6Y81]